MHILSSGQHVHNGRCTSIRRCNTFTSGDASLEPDGPPLPRPSHPGLILLRPTDASPQRLIRCARPLAEAIRSRWAMHIHSPMQYVHHGRCTSIRRCNTFTSGDASLEPDGPPLPRPSHPGLILLRPTDASPQRLIRCARPLAEAIRSRWAMHIHSPMQYVHHGRCTSIRRCNTFTSGDASLEPDGPPLPRPSHPGLILLRPTDASPLRLIHCARALAEASRSQWAMHILSQRQHVHNGRCLP